MTRAVSERGQVLRDAVAAGMDSKRGG